MLDLLAHFGRIDVAGHHQAGILRRVVLPEELAHVLGRGRRQVFHVSDHRPVIRMILGVHQLVDLRVGHAVRRVLDTLAPLVLHHVALAVHHLLRDDVEQVAHAVGLEEQRQVQRVGWHVDVVVRAVVRSGCVIAATGRLEQRVEQALFYILGAFEHQVLEQVREAGTADLLVGGSRVVPDVDRHHGHAVILVQDHRQAVGEREHLVGNCDLASCLLLGAGRGGQAQRQAGGHNSGASS